MLSCTRVAAALAVCAFAFGAPAAEADSEPEVVGIGVLVASSEREGEEAAPPAAPRSQGDLPPLELQFETDERLFTVIAWLQWVGDRGPESAGVASFPEESALVEHLAARKLPDDMRGRHRRAYEAFLPGTSLYVKNGLLIASSISYGPPPSFAPQPGSALERLDARAQADWKLRLASLPPASLMEEFHSEAQLRDLWEQRMKRAHRLALEHYRPRAEKMMRGAYAFLKVPLRSPVSYRINLAGNYGILGQTNYSPWEQRFLISLHFGPIRKGAPAAEVEYWEDTNLRVMRHELAHALLNDAVERHRHLLAPALKKMAEELKLDWLTELQVEAVAPEWVADCIGYLDLPPHLHDNVAYYNRNLLYLHFVERLPDFRSSGKGFAEFLPDLFSSFDAEKEIARWNTLAAKKEAAGEI